MRLSFVILASTAFALPTAAMADQATGWARWEAKAAEILAAVQAPGHSEAKRQSVKDACKGVTGTVIGQGFAFPRWAQGLMPMCADIDDIVGGDREVARRNWRIQCRSIKNYRDQLGKATPVAIAPTAHEKALALANFLGAYYERECAHGLERSKD
jgi:hypothetical protein